MLILLILLLPVLAVVMTLMGVAGFAAPKWHPRQMTPSPDGPGMAYPKIGELIEFEGFQFGVIAPGPLQGPFGPVALKVAHVRSRGESQPFFRVPDIVDSPWGRMWIVAAWDIMPEPERR